jgi:hypothetical protein
MLGIREVQVISETLPVDDLQQVTASKHMPRMPPTSPSILCCTYMRQMLFLVQTLGLKEKDIEPDPQYTGGREGGYRTERWGGGYEEEGGIRRKREACLTGRCSGFGERWQLACGKDGDR